MKRLGLALAWLAFCGCGLKLLQRVQPEPLSADHTERDYVPGFTADFKSGPAPKARAACPEPPAGADAAAWDAQARCLEGHGIFGAAERAHARAKSAQEPSSPSPPQVAQ